jgi:23S rRNA pseudouridine2604 synthase
MNGRFLFWTFSYLLLRLILFYLVHFHYLCVSRTPCPAFLFMKIDQYIANCGYASRRKAKDLIEEKRVTVNGKIANFSTRFNPGDKVMVDEDVLVYKEREPVYLAYHKPKGVVCTTEKITGNIIDAIKYPEAIYPVGRLDKDSEGLILMTNEGPMIDRIANAANGHEKEYLVTLNMPVRSKFLDEVSAGIEIMGEMTKPCKVWVEPGTKRLFRIILTQGLNRQIRRMCNAYDYQVLKLQRLRVMNITLDGLKPGEWRKLSPDELSKLKEAL